MEKSHPLRILFVEDVPSDAELAQREIRKGDLEFSALRVDTKGTFLRALEEYQPDVIVSDYSMPEFDGMQALKLSLKKDPTIPFIVLTGSMNEETAIMCMKAGASDYVIKEQMSRLPFAVRDALEQRRSRVEKNEAERALRESEQKYRTLVDNANETILVVQEGLIRFVNRNATEVTGHSEQDLLTRAFTEFIHPDDRAMVVQNYAHRMKGGDAPSRYTFRIITKEGIAKWVETASTMTIWNGKPATLNFLTDITDRKKAEEEISMLGHAVKSIGECVSITDLQDKVLFVNEAFLRTYEYEEGELLGKNISIVRSVNNNAEMVRGVLPSTIDGSWQGELVNRRKDGSEFPVALSTSVVADEQGKAVALIGVAVDITERKRAEEQLRQSEDLFRLIAENAADLIAVLDLDGKRIYSSPSYRSLLGNPQLLRGTDSFQEIHPEDQENIRRIFFETVKTGIGQRAEYRFLLEDGSVRHIESHGSVIRNENGNTNRVVVVSRDVTDRKLAEAEIQKNRELLNSIFETSRDGIVLEDEHGIITFVNSPYVKLLGYSHENELIGQNVSILRAPEDSERMLEYSRKRLSGEEAPSVYEYMGRRRDGSLVDIEVSVAATEIGRKKHILSVVRDIRDRKKAESAHQVLEDRIRQAQKMESIGTLAGGIAHDFNNILGIILGHLSIVRREDYDEAMRTASAETITSAVQRGANLVRQILTFARKSDVELVPVNVNESAKEIRKMLAETFPKSIEFAIVLEKGLPFVIIDSGQLHQALLNLCVNARDAVADAKKDTDTQSKITLKTALVTGKKLRERFPEVSAEQYVAISVTDTGTGMDESTRKRIFEPFFTTKEKGKGTGLGLAVVYGVVKSAHGIVDVESEPGRGSVFTLYLPVPKEASLSEPKREKQLMKVRGGTETIFIVEDEETMLAVLKLSLQNKGYRIISAVDGREALEKFKEHNDHIDLVITDFGLPKLSGEILVREMKRLKPGIRIIVASGYVDPDQRTELLKLGAKDIIMKPYEQSEVLEKVRSVLDER